MKIRFLRVRVAIIVNKRWSIFLNRYWERPHLYVFPPDWDFRQDESPISRHWFLGPIEVAHWLRQIAPRDLILTEDLPSPVAAKEK